MLWEWVVAGGFTMFMLILCSTISIGVVLERVSFFRRVRSATQSLSDQIEEALKSKKDAIMRFVEGYREAVDWMYSDPKAIKMYADKVRADENMIKESVKEFHPKAALQSDTMADLDAAVADAVKLKFLDKPLTKEQLAEFIQTPPRKK